ncbi:MAG: hypothetical protein M1818_000777 [Claussenomyces sp. TS43310]|nr:MAG: hypothetical protein M1818_000777 [Claussenomyces sp. TS43310]
MANINLDNIYDYFEDDDDDSSSDASLESDVEHPIERILAEFTGRNSHVWYLVKWQNCPLVRSSWECAVIFNDVPWIFKEWELERQRQAEGKSKPLDIPAFNKTVLEVELAERYKRRFRHMLKHAQTVLERISAT